MRPIKYKFCRAVNRCSSQLLTKFHREVSQREVLLKIARPCGREQVFPVFLRGGLDRGQETVIWGYYAIVFDRDDTFALYPKGAEGSSWFFRLWGLTWKKKKILLITIVLNKQHYTRWPFYWQTFQSNGFLESLKKITQVYVCSKVKRDIVNKAQGKPTELLLWNLVKTW